MHMHMHMHIYIHTYIHAYMLSVRRAQAIESAQRDESQQIQALVDNKEAGLWSVRI